MNAQGNGPDRNADLYRGILMLKTPEEVFAFFEDLCTVTELMALEQRFAVAQMLEFHCAYKYVLEQTGVSSATVSRVRRCVRYGSGGYRTVIHRLEEADDQI